MKQNPFSLYDFLGYLIPGSTLIYLFIIIENWTKNKNLNNLESIFSSVSKDDFQEVFFFIILSYAIGHLLSFISSITIEKYGNWKYGYPSKTVIGFEKNSFWTEIKPIEELQDNKLLYEIENDQKKRKLKNFGRFILILILLPLFVIEFIFGFLLNFKNFYSKGLDSYLMKVIIKNTILLLNSRGLSNVDNINENDLRTIDFNRIVHHYTFENSKEHQFRMVNYVALYGFLRNLVLIFILSFWYYFKESIKTIDPKMSFDWNVFGINILLMCLSYIAFMAYMKFYRRYTLEGLMLIVVDQNIKETK